MEQDERGLFDAKRSRVTHGAIIRANVPQEARREATDAEETCEKYAAILPERVLQENNSNLFFSCINDGDELLLLPKSGSDYVAVDVGDLHAIRITRYQCNCSGDCRADVDDARADRDHPVNRALSSAEPVSQYCCRVAAPASR